MTSVGGEVLAILRDWIFVRPAEGIEAMVVTNVRLPRLLLAGLVGAALALCGVALQVLFRNPLVSPKVLGLCSVRRSSIPARGPRRIGYVPQNQQGSESHSCLDLVLMARAAKLDMFSLPSKKDRALAYAAMERVGATRFVERLFGTLSGGERQIVLLARALATGSDVLMLDEPAAALDLANQDLLLCDGVAASGYLSHLKLPHYSDCAADLARLRRIASGEPE